jgi:hypothetical protein
LIKLKAHLSEVVVLGNDGEAVEARVVPDGLIGLCAQADQLYMDAAGEGCLEVKGSEPNGTYLSLCYCFYEYF